MVCFHIAFKALHVQPEPSPSRQSSPRGQRSPRAQDLPRSPSPRQRIQRIKLIARPLPPQGPKNVLSRDGQRAFVLRLEAKDGANEHC